MTETTSVPGELPGYPQLLSFVVTDSTNEKFQRLLSNQNILMTRHMSQGVFADEVYFQAVEALKAINETLKQISQKLGPDKTVPPPPPEIT